MTLLNLFFSHYDKNKFQIDLETYENNNSKNNKNSSNKLQQDYNKMNLTQSSRKYEGKPM